MKELMSASCSCSCLASASVGAEGVCAGRTALFDIAITSNRVRRYYTPTGRFVRKSCAVDFKVQDDLMLDCVI